MSSQTLGEHTSEIEVTHISSHGIWLYVRGEEFFLSYDEFPWFKESHLNQVLNVEEVSPGHFYWPELDVDLGIETIKNPQRFPLKAK